jgi:hypothetical protein
VRIPSAPAAITITITTTITITITCSTATAFFMRTSHKLMPASPPPVANTCSVTPATARRLTLALPARELRAAQLPVRSLGSPWKLPLALSLAPLASHTLATPSLPTLMKSLAEVQAMALAAPE